LNAKYSRTSNYRSNFRFYFTSCKVTALNSISKTEVKKLVAENTFNGLLDNTEGVSFDQTNQGDLDATDVATKDVKDVKGIQKNQEVLETRVIDTNRDRIRREVLLI